MATLQNLIDEVRDNVADPNKVRWTDTSIVTELNRAAVKLAQFARKSTSLQVDTPANTPYIADTTGLLSIDEAFIDQGSYERYELDVHTGAPHENTSCTGAPTDLYFDSGYLHLRPVPTSDVTLTVSGVQAPTAMANPSDTCSLADGEGAIVARATWMLLAKDGDQSWVNWKNIWEQESREYNILEAQRNPITRKVGRTWPTYERR